MMDCPRTMHARRAVTWHGRRRVTRVCVCVCLFLWSSLCARVKFDMSTRFYGGAEAQWREFAALHAEQATRAMAAAAGGGGATTTTAEAAAAAGGGGGATTTTAEAAAAAAPWSEHTRRLRCSGEAASS